MATVRFQLSETTFGTTEPRLQLSETTGGLSPRLSQSLGRALNAAQLPRGNFVATEPGSGRSR